ncbi:MAG: ribose 5-phosphate isomerase B [Clostridia bacterium]|nr:ribose 5-phosphate isomerase B [Clostridia bacterium]
MSKTIVLGCDHAGYLIKDHIIDHVKEKGYTVIEVGTYSADSCHYPIFAHRACKKLQDGEADIGILICGTGIGMSMAANKHKGIRAACCSDTFSARLTRQHNNANVLCFGERVIGKGLALELVDAFLDTEFEGGKHATRIGMVADIENGTFEE